MLVNGEELGVIRIAPDGYSIDDTTYETGVGAYGRELPHWHRNYIDLPLYNEID